MPASPAPLLVFVLGAHGSAAAGFVFDAPAALLPSSPPPPPPRPRTLLRAERTATFGMGCFWAPSEAMLEVEGVTEAVAGYTGNPMAASPPTYDAVCYSSSWVEAVRVTYDDGIVTYPELLDRAFERHEARLGSRQYGAFVFPEDSAQARDAREWLDAGTVALAVRERDRFPLSATVIEPATTFYRAEGYHQNYWAKWRPRLAAYLGLLAVASGALGPGGIGAVSDPVLAHDLAGWANGIGIAGALGALLERKLDAKVVEMK